MGDEISTPFLIDKAGLKYYIKTAKVSKSSIHRVMLTETKTNCFGQHLKLKYEPENEYDNGTSRYCFHYSGYMI